MDGFFLVDKKRGETSFDVVRRIRRETGTKKVGHSGTLDPLATGLLMVAVGQSTKLLQYLIGMNKVYEVTARFGYKSDSYDADGKIEEVNTMALYWQDEIEKIVEQKFWGQISQMPPKYSALKVGGKRACDLMREGKDVELKSRSVFIDKFEVVDYEWPEVRFLVGCSSGTYIRSLVHELGVELECGAYVSELRRLSIGSFSFLNKKNEHGFMLMEEVAKQLEYIDLDKEKWMGLQDGKMISSNKIVLKGDVMAFYKNKLVGVLESVDGGEALKFKKMIVRDDL